MTAEKLVFLDESGVNINMTRHYGRGKGKERVYEDIPFHTPKNTTMLSSIRLDGSLAYCFFQGSVNGEKFLEYIKNILVPTLQKGDIVIMDNLSCHKVKGVKEAIEKAEAKVIYLPAYSPDFNPIEMMWSKIKSLLRKWKARSIDLLDKAIKEAFELITVNDISGWFSKAGYSISKMELL